MEYRKLCEACFPQLLFGECKQREGTLVLSQPGPLSVVPDTTFRMPSFTGFSVLKCLSCFSTAIDTTVHTLLPLMLSLVVSVWLPSPQV